ncbi:hypothetical protein GCM10020331_066400 [Ectobacillus funiculus]
MSAQWTFSGIDTGAIEQTKSKASFGKKVGSCKLCGENVVDKGDFFYGCSHYAKKQNAALQFLKKY